MEIEKKYLDKIISSTDLILKNGESSCVMLSKEGDIEFLNDAFLKLTGYDESLKGKNFFDIFIEDESVKDVFSILVMGGEKPKNVNNIIKKDGSKVLMLWENYTLKDDSGSVFATLSFGQDVGFRTKYAADVKRINEEYLTFTTDYEKNIEKLVKLAFEISGANACLYNKVSKDNFENIYAFGISDFPKIFPIEGSLCGELLKSNEKSIEMATVDRSDFFEKRNLKYYFGVSVFLNYKKIGVLCFLFDKVNAHIKKDRLSILASMLGIQENNKILRDNLLKEKDRYKGFFDRMPYGIYFMDLYPEKKVTYVNDTSYELTGYTKDELYAAGGKIMDTIIYKEDRQKFLDFIASPDAFKKTLRLRWVKKDGSIIWTERTLSPVFDGSGKIKAVQGVVRDITSEMKYNEDMNNYTKSVVMASHIDSIFLKNEPKKVYQILLETMLDLTESQYGLMGFLDDNGDLVVKAMTEKVYGDCKMEDKIPRSIIKDSKSVWAETLKTGKMKILEKRLNLPLGHVKIDSALAMPLSYGEKIFGLIILANGKSGFAKEQEIIVNKIALHIADRIYNILENETLKRKEEKMRENVANAMRLESLGVFAAGIGHDFNNFLASISANLSYLKEKVREKEIVNETMQISDMASSLAKQLMFFSKSGQKPLKENIDIKDFLKDFLNFMKRSLVVNMDIEIDSNICHIFADKGQISQALSNIIINASQAVLKATSPRIKVKAFKYVKKTDDGLPALDLGEYAVVSVTDNGPGIKPENIKRLFEPYFTTKKDGNGLGLYVTYSVIKNHSGYIDVKNIDSGGACFSIYIPCALAAVSGNDKALTESDFEKIRVLILDDEEFVLKSLSRILDSFGFDVFTASIPGEAYEICRKENIDLVFVDLTLKAEDDGTAANMKIKNIAKNIYSVVSSGYSDMPVLSQHTEYGFDDIMPKPYKLDDVKRVLERYFLKKKK